MKYLMPLLILINCLMIQGILEWTVVGKVTEYGQNVTLFCNVPNCCPDDAGWDRWTPHQQTLFIDVKTGRPNKKYDGKVLKDGYTLIIQNLTKNDLNVSYSCLYGVTFGERKYLLEEDVFTFLSTTQHNVTSVLSQVELAALITGVIVLVSVTISICVWRRIRKKGSETIGNKIGKDKEIDGKKLELAEVIPLIISETIEDKIREYKEIEKEKHANLEQKIMKLENEQEEAVPKNIRDQMQKQIEDWEKKDKMFVSTRASNHVMKRLQDNSCLTLTAPSGVGKSFIARHVAIVLKNEGYNIIPVYLPIDIRTYYQPNKQTVFVVDDICGNFTANEQQIDNWKQLLPVINTIIADKCCKIIVSCRSQVYKDNRFDKLLPFKSCECNLISKKLCYTDEEKLSIAHKYIAKYDIDQLSLNSEFFPLLCSLYNEEKHGDVTDFFAKPHFVYKKELDNLNSCDELGKYKICSLALCVLFNNQLREEWFDGGVTDEQRHIIEDTCDACEISRSTPKTALKKALDTLDSTFVCKNNGIYSTIHDKLFDILAHYFGQKTIKCLIEYGESGLIHERFIWQKSQDYKNSGIDGIIDIPDKYLKSYFQRIIKDWSVGKVADVFNNNNMKVSSFRQQLLQYLLQLDKSQQVTLANTKDTVRPKESCNSGITPLVYACYADYIDMVQWLLHNDVDVNQFRDDRVTGLIIASQEGNTDIVKLLLEKDPNVNIRDENACSPLYWACQEGHTDIVQLLLEKDPNVDLCNINGCSPLYIASEIGDTEIVKLLLEKDPDVNLCNNIDCSPLYIAGQNRHIDIVKLLLQKDPDVNLRVNEDESPLLQASCTGYTELVRLLLENDPNVDLCNTIGCSPLLMASQNGHTDIIKLLLEKDPNIDLRNNDDCSPLFIASMNGHTDIVKLLLEKNPNIDLCNVDGCSPLFIASMKGYTNIVKILLEKDPNVNLCPKNGASPLVVACHMGHTDIIRLLLEKGSNVDLSGKDGITPLILSCHHNNTSIVQLLIKHQPDINAQAYDGSHALYLSTRHGNKEITELLLENNADSNICMHSKQFVTDMFNSMHTLDREKQASFDFLTKNTRSRVANYVSKKSIDYAFDLEAGSSPLQQACFLGEIDIVYSLLNHNANINMTKEDGTTPLFFACELGHEDIVRLLLDKGADTHLCRIDGKSPLNIATDNGHTSLVMLLTNYIEKED